MPDFTGMIKHVGILNNTGKNVVVVFMSLPEDEGNALVIDTDALPDNYNEALRRVVESVEGQQARNLGDILGRRISPDGQLTLLQKFHAAQRLQKVPTTLISMTPRKGLRWPLVEVLKSLDIAKESEPLGFDELDAETRAAVAADLQKFNVHANNMNSQQGVDRSDEARGLIQQAKLMEEDAQNLRIKAYKMDPNLLPVKKKVVSAPVPVALLETVETIAQKPKEKIKKVSI